MNVKSQVVGWLRNAGLLSVAEQLRFYWQKFKYRKENSTFKKEHPGLALPPEFFIYETYRLNYKWYYEDGRNTAEEIVVLFSKYVDLTKSGRRFLDWGCGPGRLTRHFPVLLPNTEIYGTDYNKKYIDWCSKNLPGITFSTNGIDSPLGYRDGFFDAIIGLSIFTHFSEENHFRWINELARITKTGGILLLTTQGEAYYTKLTGTEKMAFDSDKLVIRKYVNEGNRLYAAFQPAKYMRQLLEARFQILAYTSGKMENNEPSQDSWVLQKK